MDFEKMRDAADRQGMTMLASYYPGRDDESPWCLCAREAGKGLWHIADYWYCYEDDRFYRTRDCGQTYSLADIVKLPPVAALLEACKAFVEAWEKCLQLEKTDVALRMAKEAIAQAKAFVEAWEKCLQLEKTDVALRMTKEAIAQARGRSDQP